MVITFAQSVVQMKEKLTGWKFILSTLVSLFLEINVKGWSISR